MGKLPRTQVYRNFVTRQSLFHQNCRNWELIIRRLPSQLFLLPLLVIVVGLLSYCATELLRLEPRARALM